MASTNIHGCIFVILCMKGFHFAFPLQTAKIKRAVNIDMCLWAFSHESWFHSLNSTIWCSCLMPFTDCFTGVRTNERAIFILCYVARGMHTHRTSHKHRAHFDGEHFLSLSRLTVSVCVCLSLALAVVVVHLQQCTVHTDTQMCRRKRTEAVFTLKWDSGA